MGLSDEERFSHMAYSVRAMVKLGRELEDEYGRYDRLKKLTKRLWPAMLGRERNTLFWILGGTTHGDVVSGNSLFDQVLLEAKEGIRDTDEWAVDYERDYKATFVVEWLSVGRILGHNGNSLGKVYEIQEWTEKALYGLRRYDDKMANGMKELDKVICKIQGEIFDIFADKKEEILEAWLISHIVNKLVTWDDDIVKKWWKSDNNHHDMFPVSERELKVPLKRLMEIYTKVQFATPSINDRILYSIELMGAHWHYVHSHKDAIALFSEHNKSCPKDQVIDLKAVEEAATRCTELKKKRDAMSKASYESGRYCRLTENCPSMDELRKPTEATDPQSDTKKAAKKATKKKK